MHAPEQNTPPQQIAPPLVPTVRHPAGQPVPHREGPGVTSSAMAQRFPAESCGHVQVSLFLVVG